MTTIYGYSLDGGKTWQYKQDPTGTVKLGKSYDSGKTFSTYRSFLYQAPTPTPTPTPTPGLQSIGKLAVVNASSETDADVTKWTNACKKQCDLHVSQFWTYTVDIEFVAKGAIIPKADYYCGILNDSTQAGVLGWHEYMNGKPAIKIFTKECRKYGLNPSTTLSHEFAEMIGDIDCSTTVKGYDESGKACLYFRENADPVEAYEYNIDGVQVSDFITPQWFVKDSTLKLDYTGQCTKPFQILNGGYMEVSYDNGQTWTQIDKFSKQKEMHTKASSRWAIYKKVQKGEPLQECEIQPGVHRAGGILLNEL
jgi:hypothetical protein